MLNLYSVRDVKGECFDDGIITASTDGLAVRIFQEACSDPRTRLAKFPSDFFLYRLGSYDPLDGKIIPEGIVRQVASATQFVNVKPVEVPVVTSEVVS